MAELESAPNRLRTTALGERPQERMERLGPAALSDSELLAMLLRSGTRGLDVLTVADLLLTKAGSLGALLGWTQKDFQRQKGVGRVKSLQLVTVMEISRRAMRQSQENQNPMLVTAEDVMTHCQSFVSGLAVEKFWVLCMNRRNRLIRGFEVTSGTAGSTLAHPREVFRDAIRESASAIICVHNHPSGDPSPSAADIQVTRQLREASKTVQIDLLDHIILGTPAADPGGLGYYSFRASGLI